MLREGNVHSLHWADKTMSILRERQLEASADRLNIYPQKGLFSGCDDLMVEELWKHSNDAQEYPTPARLHTVWGLRRLVLAQLPGEAALLAVEEAELVERLFALGGEIDLFPEEISAGESLVRRLWCTFRREGERFILTMPDELLTPLQMIFATPTHEEIRTRLMNFDFFVGSMLHLGGFLHYEAPLRHLLSDVVAGTYADQRSLALRYLRAAYDYMIDRHGGMILLHPGLAEPDKFIYAGAPYVRPIPEGLEAQRRYAMLGLLPEEEHLYLTMCGLLRGSVRPELTEDMAVRDLLILAKQSVALPEMLEVLSSMLTQLPTPAMLDGLRSIAALTPRRRSKTTALEQ